ncbi:rhomboid-related protein 2-like isoform X1 [Melanaphis sacchari]|uniref:rhomboid-related protein 2-like isoform X1 n=2 Tax=Melanaphis sacchari TaxID=742174 RepID=UPI000DC133D1|nr:rhomboid-related protein 2-like isoform X1 [Melanaphis sacchari]XP_025194981.1 rhomboid-related protein 2-like isoform X1 [Melanaphis sacchari]
MRVSRRYFELMVSVINPSSDLYHHSPLAPLASFDSSVSGIESSSTQSEKNCLFKDFILNDKWRSIFDKYDPEGFGEIPWNDFLMLLNSSDFVKFISQEKRDILLERARLSNTSAITFQDFVNIMSGKRRRSFKCAIHHRDKEINSENDFHIIFQEPTLHQKMVRFVAEEFLTDERDRKYYADNYRCCPPPLFILLITIFELGTYLYYYSLTLGSTPAPGDIWASVAAPVPMDSVFIYRPDKRQQLWRFMLYMFLHVGWVHLIFNLTVQLLVGLPLEMVHGSLRIGVVYMAGVLAGSLGTSVFDSNVYLVGASGGVYALLAAHLANVMLNYNNMEFGVFRLLGILFIASVDVGFAVYCRYAFEPSSNAPPVSYVAHIAGALAGLTIGLLVLKNFEQKLHEQLIWWFALGVYAICTLFAVAYNLSHPC